MRREKRCREFREVGCLVFIDADPSAHQHVDPPDLELAPLICVVSVADDDSFSPCVVVFDRSESTREDQFAEGEIPQHPRDVGATATIVGARPEAARRPGEVDVKRVLVVVEFRTEPSCTATGFSKAWRTCFPRSSRSTPESQ